ncbi:MAG: Fe-S cluster assembly protein SufD [Bacteroidota bacterium]
MAGTIIQSDSRKDTFVSNFRPVKLNGNGHLTPLQQKGEKALEDASLPTRKWEEWKYTSLQNVYEGTFLPSSSAGEIDITSHLIPGLEADILVFHNGEFQSELSNLSGEDKVTISTLGELDSDTKAFYEKHSGQFLSVEKNIFSALNASYAKEGVLVHVSSSATKEKPLFVLHLFSGASDSAYSASQHRNLIWVERNAEVSIVEKYVNLGEGKTFHNQTTEIFVGDDARCKLTRFQEGARQGSSVEQTQVHIGKNANFTISTLSFGGDLVRNNLEVFLDGEHSEAHLFGTYMLDGLQHVDNHTQVHHKVPNCFSNELYKGIIHEKGTAVFNGRINVYQDAQKTNAFQSNRNILLSPTANIFTKPQLEIYADDVKCSHGATTGQLDTDAMFYLKARGINEREAKMLLIQAFIGEVTENLSIEAVQMYANELIANRFTPST